MDYKKILGDISKRADSKKVEYYVLVHKKHKRVICFRDNPRAISFIKPKFKHSVSKNLIYSLISLGFHRLLLKKVMLSENLGDVIYIANSVKAFNLLDECVYTFESMDKKLSEFSNNMRIQKFLSRNNLAPKLLLVNDSKRYYTEELLYDGKDGKIDMLDIIKKLSRFYNLTYRRYVHGDFMKDHIKVDNNGEVKFIDWNIRRGNPDEDFKNYIRRLGD